MKPLATGGLNRAPKERTRKRPAGQAEQFASAASAFQSRLGRERERGSSKKLHSAGCGVFLSPFFCCVFLSFPRAPSPPSDAPPPSAAERRSGIDQSFVISFSQFALFLSYKVMLQAVRRLHFPILTSFAPALLLSLSASSGVLPLLASRTEAVSGAASSSRLISSSCP